MQLYPRSQAIVAPAQQRFEVKTSPSARDDLPIWYVSAVGSARATRPMSSRLCCPTSGGTLLYLYFFDLTLKLGSGFSHLSSSSLFFPALFSKNPTLFYPNLPLCSGDIVVISG
jgi:hypothetical protein